MLTATLGGSVVIAAGGAGCSESSSDADDLAAGGPAETAEASMIYEERRIRLKPRSFPDYRTFVLESLWPRLAEAGHRPLCLLNGRVGAGSDDVVLIVGYDGYDAWQSAQPAITGAGPGDPPRSWIADEQARLMTPSPYRPTPTTPDDDRRAVYGLRRWWIEPDDWDEFARLSFEGVWPAMDHMGHWVLGQFRTAATTSPLEIVNLAGYRDAAHWEATRDPVEQGVPEEKVELLRTLGAARRALVHRSFVTLMTAHWP